MRFIKQTKFFDEFGSASDEDKTLYAQMNEIKEQYSIEEAEIKMSIMEGLAKPDPVKENMK